MRPLIHLVCGSTGAGKTTLALELAESLHAVRFSIDEWMAALFWMDSPKPIVASWSLERIERCYSQIWSTARQVAAVGTACILDLGFSQRRSREQFYERARAASFPVQLHFLDIPKEERWARVQKRNSGEAGVQQLGFAVSREMFDFVETLWEAPGPDEMSAHAGLRHEPK